MIKAKELEHDTVLNLDGWDKRKFNTMFNLSKNLQTLERQLQAKLEENKIALDTHSFLTDTWGGLFKMFPEVQGEINPNLNINKKLTEHLLNNDSFQNYREYTRLDDVGAVLGTHAYSGKALDWFLEEVNKNEQLKSAMEQMQQANDALASGRKTKKKKEAQEHAQQAFEQVLEQAVQNGKFNQVMQDAGKKAKETNEQMKGLLGNGYDNSPAKMKKVPLAERLELAELLQNNNKLKKVAEWAGKFKAIAQKKQRAKHVTAPTRNGIKIGNDVELLLPSELMNYHHRLTKLDFLKRFAEGNTFQYANRGKEQLGKGAIVCCLDQSGSMRNIQEQSIGYVLALMLVARKQKRDFVYIPFSAGVGTIRKFEKGVISIKQMTEIATEFLNGGTSFEAPLNAATRQLEGRFKNADIVFITDGLCDVSAYFLENFSNEKKQKKFQVLSMFICDTNRSTNKEKAVAKLGAFSEKVEVVNDFEDSNALKAFEL